MTKLPHHVAMISFHTCPLAAQEGKETGGMNVYVLELSKELAKLGIQVDMFTRAQDPQNPLIVPVAPNCRVIHLQAGPAANISKKELKQYIPDFVDAFLNFSQKEYTTYDVIHCHYYLSGLIGLELQNKVPNMPKLAITFHTLALMKNLVARSEAEQEKPERVNDEFDLVEKVDQIIAPSESDCDYLHYLYNADQAKIAVVPPGFNSHLFKPMAKSIAKKHIGADEHHKIVMFVGRIEPLKGIDSIIYAMKILAVEYPELPACLWVVGGDISLPPDQWSQELKKLDLLRKQLRINTTVKFLGQQSQDELPFYLNAAEVVVMPSHYESFGMSALEAMACGVPVLTTNVSGISGLLDERHDILIASVNNPLLLADQIAKVIKDGEERHRLSHVVHDTVQDLSWEKVAVKMQKAYKQ